MTKRIGKKIVMIWLISTCIFFLVSSGLSVYTVYMVGKRLNKEVVDQLIHKEGIDQYTTYAEALQQGDRYKFLAAKNGLAWRGEVLGAKRYWAFDYSWLSQSKPAADDIVRYLKNHKILMFIRVMALSDRTMVGAVSAIFLGCIGWLLQGTIARGFTRFYARRKAKMLGFTADAEGGERESVIHGSLYTLTKMHLVGGAEVVAVSVVFSLLLAYFGVLTSDNLDILGIVGLGYFVLLVVVVWKIVRTVVQDVDNAPEEGVM